MADMPDASQLGISIVTTTDPAGIEDAQAQLDALQGNIDEVGASFDALGGQADVAATDVSGAADEMSASFGTAGDANKVANDGIIASNSAVVASYREVGVAADASAAQQDTSAAGKDLAKGALGGAGAGGLASAISNPYVVAGAAIAGGLALAIKSASDLQSQIVKLYDTAGETTPLQTLTKGIQSVSDATGESTSELTSALYFISSAGYNAAGGLDVLKASAEGAKEENSDLTTVANALTTVMHDYGASSSQSASYMNQLLVATSEGKMTLQDFSSSLSTVLPLAHTVGLSFAQVAGAEATLTESGITAQQSTDDLRAVIQGIETPTATAIKNMQQYGLSSVDLAQNLGKDGLTGTINEVVAAIAKQTQGGLVIQNAMQSSQVAVQDLNKELANSPSQLQALEKQLLSGTISFTDYKKAVQNLPEGLTNLGKQFETTYNDANSFNKALTSGSPAAQTIESALKGVFTQANSVQGVLALTGTNAAIAQNNISKVGDAAKTTGNDVNGWKEQQGTFNTQMSILGTSAVTIAQNIGEHLLPALTSLARDMEPVLSGIARFTANAQDMHSVGVLIKAAFDIINAPAIIFLKTLSAINDEWTDLKKLFDGGLGSSNGGLSLGAIGSQLKNLIHIPGFATGTSNAPGGWSIVGENGPEAMYVPRGAQVYTNGQMSSVMASSTVNSNNQASVSIGAVYLGDSSAVNTFFQQIDRDTQLQNMGLSPARGIV